MNQFNGKKVFITGATGFMGANLATHFLTLNARVGVTIREGSDRWRLQDILPQLEILTVDLKDHENLYRSLVSFQPQYVFHFAVDRLISTPKERLNANQANLTGLQALLEAALDVGVSRFVFSGTSQEYGVDVIHNQRENVINPASLYAAMKASGSLLCEQYAKNFGLPVTILRYFHVYGYYESHNKLIPTAVMRAYNQQSISLTESKYHHDLVFIEDVIEATLLAASVEDAVGEIINIGSGKQYNNQQVVAQISKLMQRQIQIIPEIFPPRRSDLETSIADLTAARRILNWEPKHSLETGLEKTIDWLLAHQKYYQSSLIPGE